MEAVLIFIIYALVGYVAYDKVFSKWEHESKFTQIWYSCAWLAILPLRIIHQIRYWHGDCKK